MASIRDLPNSRANPEDIDQDDAYNRAQARAQDVAQDRLDPQPGPVEKRDRASRRRVPGF